MTNLSKIDQNMSKSVEDRNVKTTKGRVMADRYYISQLGEPYFDMLKVEAWLKQRTMAAEGNSLLCSSLMRREEYRNQLIQEVARKRGIPFQQMWDDILTGRVKPMSPEEYEGLLNQREPDSPEEF